MNYTAIEKQDEEIEMELKTKKILLEATCSIRFLDLKTNEVKKYSLGLKDFGDGKLEDIKKGFEKLARANYRVLQYIKMKGRDPDSPKSISMIPALLKKIESFKTS